MELCNLNILSYVHAWILLFFTLILKLHRATLGGFLKNWRRKFLSHYAWRPIFENAAFFLGKTIQYPPFWSFICGFIENSYSLKYPYKIASPFADVINDVVHSLKSRYWGLYIDYGIFLTLATYHYSKVVELSYIEVNSASLQVDICIHWKEPFIYCCVYSCES